MLVSDHWIVRLQAGSCERSFDGDLARAAGGQQRRRRSVNEASGTLVLNCLLDGEAYTFFLFLAHLRSPQSFDKTELLR